MKPTFFKSGAEFRAWLERRHRDEVELLLGFYKTGSKKKGVTYQEALDEALAFGKRDERRSAIYSYERGGAELDAESSKQFKADKKAWAFHRAQAPWYQRTSAY